MRTRKQNLINLNQKRLDNNLKLKLVKLFNENKITEQEYYYHIDRYSKYDNQETKTFLSKYK